MNNGNPDMLNNTRSDYTRDPESVLSAERARIGREPQCGLALSGGGIRSASFCLGVLQALVTGGVMPNVDYLSTVSGGGYVGSALIWWHKRGLAGVVGEGATSKSVAGMKPSNFPFGAFPDGQNSSRQQAILNYMRFHSSYLVPSSGLNLLSIIAVLLRNVLLSLLIYLTLAATAMWLISSFTLTWHGLAPSPLIPVPWLKTIIDAVVGALSGHTLCPSNLPLVSRYLEVVLYLAALFLLSAVFYSVGTIIFQYRDDPEQAADVSSRRYTLRRWAQIGFGRLLLATGMVAFLLLCSAADAYFANGLQPIVALLGVTILSVFYPFDMNLFQVTKFTDKIRRTLGALCFLAAVLFGAYAIARPHVVDLSSLPSGAASWPHVGIVVLVVIVLIVGFLVNVNYLGIHRMYRDRLMELFLPDDEAVKNQRWKPSVDGNKTVIEEMCPYDKPRPYLLINTNVVLVDSKNTKYRERGGANFIISSLYCGSDATGWRLSSKYMKKHDPGMTLATAMAVSGAAANPNAGAGGTTWNRDRFVSIMMSVLSLRLGYWAPHPDPATRWREIPNLIYPGMTSVFLAHGLREDNSILDLTDGGHFENLGLYELIRRQLSLIIVCDGSADADFTFSSLALAIERVRVDFETRVEFIDDSVGLIHVVPDAGDATSPVPLAKRGFAVARITYSDGKMGVLVYLKPTMKPRLSPELISYKQKNPMFPHEATADQFFDEIQFEAYRELGGSLASEAVPFILEKMQTEPGDE